MERLREFCIKVPLSWIDNKRLREFYSGENKNPNKYFDKNLTAEKWLKNQVQRKEKCQKLEVNCFE